MQPHTDTTGPLSLPTVSLARTGLGALGIMVLLGGPVLAARGRGSAGDELPIARSSVASSGAEGSHDSSTSSLSASGRFVAFASSADNLVPDDTNGFEDVFVADRETGRTERVSVGPGGRQSDHISFSPAISSTGRLIAFASAASNLVSDDSNGVVDIFVHDRNTGVTERVSEGMDGTEANDSSFVPAISANGRYVAFESDASNLVPDDTNDTFDIFVYDRKTGATERVSVDAFGLQSNGFSDHAAISADGRVVGFVSFATNLVPDDTNEAADVFVYDRKTGFIERVSVSSDGIEGTDASRDAVALSADGRVVAFHSFAANLVAGDTNGRLDVFVHDRQTGVTERVSVASDGTEANGASFRPALSADGLRVAFESYATNLVASDTNRVRDIFLHERASHTTVRVSVGVDGAEANAMSFSAVLSADGRRVGFTSEANNLVADDHNAARDVFLCPMR